jgi:hypothetical protein
MVVAEAQDDRVAVSYSECRVVNAEFGGTGFDLDADEAIADERAVGEGLVGRRRGGARGTRGQRDRIGVSLPPSRS